MISIFRQLILLVALAPLFLFLTGCVSLAEDVSKHLLAQDVKTMEYDHCVYQHDLALFRGCLKQRGGTCQGASTTAVPHSSQDGSDQLVPPVKPGSSSTLGQSIADLPSSNPARTAYQVLTHPVTQQAADLHNHLRGHESGGQGAICGPEPTHTMHLQLHKVQRFQEHLMSSIGHIGWEALVDHCDQLLAKHAKAPDLDALQADCRSASFIHGYLGAYLRDGKFVEVDFGLSDEVTRLKKHATDVNENLQGIQEQIPPILAQLPPQSTTSLSASDAAKVSSQTAHVVSAVDSQTHKGYQILVAQDFLQLEKANRQVGAAAAALLKTNSAANAKELATALSALSTELTNLQSGIYREGGKLDTAVDQAVSALNQRLSNVFKVQSAGFVSRDLTFGARLPTLELAIDPDFGHFKTEVTDVDTDASAIDSNQRLTGKSSLSHLGIVTTNTSGFDATGGSIGAELVRVFFEALFDSHEGLPALSQIGTQATGLTLDDPYKLPLFQNPMGKVSATDLEHLTYANNAVTLETRLLMGRLISGLGPFSLNNQPLEDLITEIITTSVRKATEKATWCWYACDLNSDVERLRRDAGKAAGDVAKKDLKDLEHRIHQDAEHVKVRFKVSP